MRILILVFTIFSISCSEKKDPTHDFKIASITYSVEITKHRLDYLKMNSAAMANENPEKFGPIHRVTLLLDTVAREFNHYADSLLDLNLPAQSNLALINTYNVALEKVKKIRLEKKMALENPISFETGDKQFKLDKYLVLNLKQNLNIAVAESMDYLAQDMYYSGERWWPEISFKQTEGNTIELSDKLIQIFNHREIHLTKILKDGKPVDWHPRIADDYTFGKISFDSLPSGKYEIKGEVRWLVGRSRFNKEPFEYTFEME